MKCRLPWIARPVYLKWLIKIGYIHRLNISTYFSNSISYLRCLHSKMKCSTCAHIQTANECQWLIIMNGMQQQQHIPSSFVHCRSIDRLNFHVRTPSSTKQFVMRNESEHQMKCVWDILTPLPSSLSQSHLIYLLLALRKRFSWIKFHFRGTKNDSVSDACVVWNYFLMCLKSEFRSFWLRIDCLSNNRISSIYWTKLISKKRMTPNGCWVVVVLLEFNSLENVKNRAQHRCSIDH